jgi:hypothetical protein
MFTKDQNTLNLLAIAKRVNNQKENDDSLVKIRFDLICQRRGCWSLKQKQDLIDSLLFGFPVPPLYFVDNKDKNQWSLDGQQRCLSITGYFNDEFALSDTLSAYVDDNGTVYEVAGKKYSELHEDVQTKLNATNMNTYKFSNITNDEIVEIFRRLNSGSAFKKMELTRIETPIATTNFLNEISQEIFFDENAKISKSAKVHFGDHEVILQTLILFTDTDLGLSGEDIKNFALNYELTEESKTKFKELMEYVNNVFPDSKSYLKKVNIPCIIKICDYALDKNVPEATLAEWFDNFFHKDNLPTEYAETTGSGCAKKQSVNTRLDIIREAFEKDLLMEN